MRAMILAAGRGERMRPLTDKTPKPLLEVSGKPLIVYQLEALARIEVEKVVINLGHLGHKIREYLGSGTRYQLQIEYSDEGDEPLETAGGIFKALPLLGDAPFIVCNADIFTDFDYASLPSRIDSEAHLVLVDNPDHNQNGDFALSEGLVKNQGQMMLTYSGIGVFHPQLFKDCSAGRYPLAPLLRSAANQGRASGQHHQGYWNDVGTPQRLDRANEYLANN